MSIVLLEAGGMSSGSSPWPFPHDPALAGMQPAVLHLCQHKSAGHNQNHTAAPAGAAPHPNTASPTHSYLRSTWWGETQANKEPGCCTHLPQEKKGCGRKRTWRGHSHRAERGWAGRAPLSRQSPPWPAPGPPPGALLGTVTSPAHQGACLWASLSHAEHLKRLVLISTGDGDGNF